MRQQERLTHETFLARLMTYTLNLTDVVKCNAVLAEQPAVDDKVAFPAFWREDRALRRTRWRLCRRYEGGQGHLRWDLSAPG